MLKMNVLAYRFLLFLFLIQGSKLSAMEFNPLVIFGDDNRQEIFSVSPQWQEISRSIAGKVSVDHIRMQGGIAELVGSPLSKKICATNRFAEQITVPSCSGFLAKPNILVTAGHCIKTQEDCDNFVWVFGYALQNPTDKGYTNIPTDQIYKCKKILSRRQEDFGAVDHAILELDRSVENRQPLKMDFNQTLSVGTPVTLIGHPSGLPLKFADAATIVEITDGGRTINTDLDAFQGNSGSPVFHAETGNVIAITSHGQSDHVRDPNTNCKVPKVCLPGDKCYWSSSSNITNLKNEF